MSESFSGCRVTRVVDGDTIDVVIVIANHFLGVAIHANRRLRLARIDTPELPTPEGKAVKAFVIEALKGVDRVTIATHGKDRDGRLVADVIFEDGGNLSDMLIKAGHAKPYPLAAMLEC